MADAEEVLRRRVIGLEQYVEALAEEEAPAVMVGGLSQRKPVGPRRTVPHREDAAGVEDLSVDYQAVMAAATKAGIDGLDARRTAVVLGWGSTSAWSRSQEGSRYLSTTQRRGSAWKPRTSSRRRTTSRTSLRSWAVQSVRWPVSPPSAQTRLSHRKRPIAAGRGVRAAPPVGDRRRCDQHGQV
ncbi:hypothetical protein ABZ915_44160 [Streptomyces sp. NPDC046915]|uniref:hypothetical protein n=1 Tax=Streptomyces sp. NPDC046915 TaxID=3155257 RepID=UPI0033D94466